MVFFNLFYGVSNQVNSCHLSLKAVSPGLYLFSSCYYDFMSITEFESRTILKPGQNFLTEFPEDL